VKSSSNFINASDYAGGFVGRRGMVKFKPEKNMVFFSISVIMKKNKQHNGQKDKQRSTKHYTEN
jgi:hypothetical protein